MSGLSFLAFADLARKLTKAEFGNWITFLAMITLAEVVRTSAIYTPLIKYIAGASNQNKIRFSGAGWVIALIITLFLGGLDGLCLLIFGSNFNSDWILFTHWFPLVFVLSLPVNFAFCQLQALENFSSILWLRMLNNGLFLIFILIGINLLNGKVSFVLYSYLLSAFISSLVALVLNWAPFLNIFKTNKNSILEIFHMSKYVMITGVSSNLLRSSDTFIINAMMGPQFVALYKTPEKILELIELPIRTIAGTAIPEMARELNQNSKLGMAKVMMKYTGILTLILIPIIIISFLLAPNIMFLIGGSTYLVASNLLRIFLFYALLLPLDRFLGISLDILGKPHLNLLKVILMLGVNVLGDIVCIHYFGNVNSVAANSFLTFVVGIVFGDLVLRKYLKFSYKTMIKEAWDGLKKVYCRILKWKKVTI